eukprot:TRINITY_DN12182_c0_g1_i1.p2 TRINITY_DN12182_c0_g1~~TRINITY_DN12182_c0_g1_i1.p2  ORF type:complete len:183 (+),score=20.99 TRINITY_DN12182_c0_g1_i1:49-597(+)
MNMHIVRNVSKTVGGALTKQSRHKGLSQVISKQMTMQYKEREWFNRGYEIDNRALNKMRNQGRNRRAMSMTRSEDRNHIGWGTLPKNNFKNVTSMRVEMVADVGCMAHGTPAVNHKNAANIVGEDFDFQKVLQERGKYQPKKGYVYDDVEYVRRWDKEEAKRLRGKDWHLKFYHGPFNLHSL